MGNTINDKPKDEILLDNIGKIAYTLDKAYMSRLEQEYGVLYFDEKYNQNKEISYIYRFHPKKFYQKKIYFFRFS